jgi:RNA polymerase sigma-70 factor (sigma-E family)
VTPEQDAEFSAWVSGSWRRLMHTAYLLSAGDAGRSEDLLQTALSRVMLAWPRLRVGAELDAYTRTVMVRLQASWWRRRWHSEQPSAQLPEGAESDPRFSSYDEADRLAQALRQLSPQQRAAVVLRYYEDLTEARVAEMLGCSIGSVKTHTARGLARLRELLDDDQREGSLR